VDSPERRGSVRLDRLWVNEGARTPYRESALFEILKIFIEQAFKLINIDALSKSRDRRKLASIGADMFSLYTSLNGIYVIGLLIVEEIEKTIERWDRYRREGKPEEPIEFYTLNSLLDRQVGNIVAFGNSFIRVAYQIDVIDPDATRRMALFISTKKNIISLLIYQLIYSRSPTSLVLSASFEKSLIAAVGKAQATDLELRYDLNDKLLHNIDCNKEDAIATKALSGKEVAALTMYLTERRPREQLEYLKCVLEKLHEKLVTTFEVKDVLMRVGARTPQDETEWVNMWHKPFEMRLTDRPAASMGTVDPHASAPGLVRRIFRKLGGQKS
jgi:hypothetical protein